MSKIQYPMSTAAVFDDVVYPICLNGPHQIESEVISAIRWFCRWNNEEMAVVKAHVLFSCWGLYLTHDQIMAEAA
ncbi:TPA: protein ninY [Raoultella planticola]|nr:protein ninY [Raoultella planticola]